MKKAKIKYTLKNNYVKIESNRQIYFFDNFASLSNINYLLIIKIINRLEV